MPFPFPFLLCCCSPQTLQEEEEEEEHVSDEETDDASFEFEFDFPFPMPLAQRLGKGAHGIVWAMNAHQAIKQVPSAIPVCQGISPQLVREAAALRALERCSGVLRAREIEICLADKHAKIVMQRFPCDLRAVLKGNPGGLPVPHTRYIVTQLLRALAAAHAVNICHRDLKPENVLIDPDTSRIALCDWGLCQFGTSTEEPEQGTSYVQTRWYRAPEILLSSSSSSSHALNDHKKIVKYRGEAIDMWSLGVLCHELLTGQPLFQGKDQRDQLLRIRARARTAAQELATFVDAQLVQLLSEMLRIEPRDRPTAAEALRRMHGFTREPACVWRPFGLSSLRTNKERAQAVEFLVQHAREIYAPARVWYLAWDYLDAVLSSSSFACWRLLAVTCLVLAVKATRLFRIEFERFELVGRTVEDFVECEAQVLKALDFALFRRTPLDVLDVLENEDKNEEHKKNAEALEILLRLKFFRPDGLVAHIEPFELARLLLARHPRLLEECEFTKKSGPLPAVLNIF